MNIIIVGAGPAGVVAAISIKRKDPSSKVTIIEHLDEPLKKVLATGNGKCNLGNQKLDWKRFNNYEFIKDFVQDYSFNEYRSYLESLRIHTKLIDDLLYPITESAITVRDALINECNKLGIVFKCSESLVDYNKQGTSLTVRTDKSEYKSVDRLIISTGAKSSPQLGSDGSIYNILLKHGYKIEELKPGLCPIHVKEKTFKVDGVRVKANVTLLKNDREIYQEQGEVLFKDKGLSGIVIFDIMSEISRCGKGNYKINIDLLPEVSKSELEKVRKNQSNSEFLRGYLHPKLYKYFIDNGYENDPIKYLKSLPFTYSSPYGFEFSHVSVGGVSLKEINHNFESKKERNVYFLGEVLDLDGPCGGYNLTWIFHSARKINL